MSKERLVPDIRFERFEGEWVETLLNDVAKVTMGQSPSGINYTTDPSDYILVQGNTDMKDGQVVPRVWTTQVTKIGIPDDIIMSVRAPVGDVGKTSYKVVLGRGVAGIRANEFIFFYLGYLKENRYWDKLSTGSTFQSINSNHLNNLMLLLPNESEQKRIGSYFQTLDNNIYSKQAELNKLQKFKQAMLQKMFPKEGETVPEVRFHGFSNEWIEIPFLNLINKIVDFRGRTPLKLGLNWSPTGHLALSALNVRNGYIDKKLDAYYGDKKLYKAWMSGNELYKGQVLMTTEAPAGNVAQIPDNEKYILSQRTIAFIPKKIMILDNFLYTLLNSFTFQQSLGKLVTGGTAKGISQRNLQHINVIYPTNKEEQFKISKYFNNLNKLIQSKQTELDKLKQFKRAMLNKMFV